MASGSHSACAGVKLKGTALRAEGLCRGLRGSLRNPQGPRTQIIGFVGPKYYNINSIWTLKPYYLGPWTLRAS